MYTKINEATNAIKQFIKEPIDIAIILGSGLGPLANLIENPIEISYEHIPHFPVSTVVGHEGKLIYGTLEGKKVLAMKGRFHYYEGHDLETVVLPVRVFKKLGINNLIVTNACGGISDHLNPGSIMLIKDHISFLLPSVLRGPNYDEFGPRFKDMGDIYTKELREMAKECAKKLDIEVSEGVYTFFQGPMFETPAEIQTLKIWGTDVVGMSTVPEAIVARHANMQVLGISLITNKAAGLSNNELNHQEVLETAKIAEENLVKLNKEIIKNFKIK